MAFLTAEVKGVSESLAAFSYLKNGVKNRVVRKAVTAASLPHLQYARKASEYHDRTKLLRRSMGRRIKTYRESGTTIAVTGARSGFSRFTFKLGEWNPATGIRGIVHKMRAGKYAKVDPRKYSHLVERGHGGPHPAPPKNFLRHAFQASRAQCESKFASKFSVELLSEASKAAARLGNV